MPQQLQLFALCVTAVALSLVATLVGLNEKGKVKEMWSLTISFYNGCLFVESSLAFDLLRRVDVSPFPSRSWQDSVCTRRCPGPRRHLRALAWAEPQQNDRRRLLTTSRHKHRRRGFSQPEMSSHLSMALICTLEASMDPLTQHPKRPQ